MPDPEAEERGLFAAVVGDGRPLLYVVAGALMFSGGFALFLSASKTFLPHDLDYLGMSASTLCHLDQCKVVDFMIHDRVAWGGTMIAIGILYVWLTAFPLSQGLAWAWWTITLSAVIGLISFLSYLGTGYLDSWHGWGTALLIPAFAFGLYMTWKTCLVRGQRSPKSLLVPSFGWEGAHAGRALMLVAAAGMAVSGVVVMLIGASHVFVPQDLQFMHTSVAELNRVNPRLVSLMAHDRQGFGGGVTAVGLMAVLIVWRGRPSRNLWQALAFSWFCLSAAAIGIHLIVGYDSIPHLGPAVLGSFLFGLGLLLCVRRMMARAR